MSKNNITYKIARKIITLGKNTDLTVNSLSKKSKVSIRTLNRIFNSGMVEYNPTIGTVQKLAKSFKMSVSQFLAV
jgi:transcriptional regulator with XRE-family HTH domain